MTIEMQEEIEFVKMHGLGNDYLYVYVDEPNADSYDWSKEAVRLSKRHTGVGADGVIVILPSDKADFKMRIFNADGSEGEMCGNGIRCVGKFVYDEGWTRKTKLDIETKAGIKHLKLIIEDGKVSEVGVNMGQPVIEKDLTIQMPDNKSFTGRSVNVGNPHFVVFVPELKDEDVLTYGPMIEKNPAFPKRTNVEFVKVVDKSHLEMRVWERGSGETMACGTGACACAYAAIEAGKCQPKVRIKLPGGNLDISYDKKSRNIFMRGPATTVFKGRVKLAKVIKERLEHTR